MRYGLIWINIVFSFIEKTKTLLLTLVLISCFLDDDLSLEIRHDLLLLFLRGLCVDIHRRLDILVAHHTLDHLQIRFVLAKPCAKSMPQMMSGKVRDHHRLPLLCIL